MSDLVRQPRIKGSGMYLSPRRLAVPVEGGGYVRIVADSTSPSGIRLVTAEWRMRRYVLAEANTHRVFSRNSASSRAIPYPKQREKVLNDPAVPPRWGSEQKGMQAGQEIDDPFAAEAAWLKASKSAVKHADALVDLGVHKSLVNRLIEPFSWHTVVVTSTAWENFLHLRDNPLAERAIEVVASAMRTALDESESTLIPQGMWHLPYIEEEDIHLAEEHLYGAHGERGYGKHDVTALLVGMSSARCARVSYETQDGRRSVEEDLRLYEGLKANGHASPLEHPATPAPDNVHRVDVFSKMVPGTYTGLILPRYGNLLGWHQHRFDAEAERDYQAFA